MAHECDHEDCAGSDELTHMMSEWLDSEMSNHGLTSRNAEAVLEAMDSMLVWEHGLANISQALVARACEQVARKVGESRGTC
jgi:hypothetical protein